MGLETEGNFDNLFLNSRISKKTGEEVGSGKPYTTIVKVWSRLRLRAGLALFGVGIECAQWLTGWRAVNLLRR